MNKGWISLHRQFMKWEWYTDANTMRLFIHCLLKANHKGKNWRGVEIKRGTFVTSLDTLKSELGLSVQKIRTSLNKLKSTNEITIKTTNLNTLISIVCYDKYQDDNKQVNKQITNKQQTNNKQITTTNNDNNINNENNDDDVLKNIDTLSLNYKANIKLIKAVTESQKIEKEKLFLLLDKFNLHLKSQGRFSETWSEYTIYFLNWLKKQPKKESHKRNVVF